MSAPAYSLEAWYRFRERKLQPVEVAESATPSLADIPPDAEMDDGITLGCWNGERFVSWEKWAATAPIVVEPAPPPAIQAGATAYSADCNGTRVWLAKDGDRWLMFVGRRSSTTRRRDFASPWLEHAIRTAEAWYGTARKGWQAESPEAGAA
jgi:hypothetical protein